jgi:predicted GNAT family acetyltransferase
LTEVRDNPEKSRYELLEDGRLLGVADYRPLGTAPSGNTAEPPRLAFPHTEIVPSRRHQGLGRQLVQGALDDVRRKRAKVVPSCWFVAQFIDEHPGYADLKA